MPHIFTPDDLDFAHGPFNKPPFGLLTAMPFLGKKAGAEKLIFDLRKLPPGEYSFPYHYHRNAEETMYIISGSITARTPNGFQIINQGSVLYFETGEAGAHQFFNHGSVPCTYFDVKTFSGLDVVVYPDSGKLMISQYNEVFDLDSQIEYFRDEGTVAEKWHALGYATQADQL